MALDVASAAASSHGTGPVRWHAAAIALLLLLVYNANGREVGSADSQPTRATVQAILTRGTLRLDAFADRIGHNILEGRPAFQRDRRRRFRSAYPVAPAVLGAAIGFPLVRLGLVDVDAPLAASFLAKLSASIIVTTALVLVFFLASRRLSSKQAAFLTLALALGTNYWPLASQTLWQHETVALGLAGALLLLAVPTERLSWARLAGAAALLGLAAASRPQVAAAVLVVWTWAVTRRRRWTDLLASWPLVVIATAVVWSNIAWFGHALGAVPRLEALHPVIHAVDGSLSATPGRGAAGLLVSPSRGLLVFSPIVLVAVAGLRRAWREGWTTELRCCAVAACTQFLVYASYSVWWGGHTYGPRYLLDLLPLLVPLAAAGLPAVLSRSVLRVVVVVALAWSVTLAGTGAFIYPADGWNTSPTDVDLAHERLWDWRDPQFRRCWQAERSARNFRLFTRDAFRPRTEQPLQPR